MPGRNEAATAAASQRAAHRRGNCMADRSARGGAAGRRIFTMRPASQRLTTLVMVASTAAAGGSTATRMSISRLGSATPRQRRARSGAAPGCEHAFERRCAARAEAVEIAAEVQHGGDHDQRADDRGPEHQMAGRIPFERRRGAPARGRPRQQREIAEPPGRQCRCRAGRRGRTSPPNTAASAGRGDRAPRSAPPNGSSPCAAIRIGSGAR